jgi:hypothetical protein
MVRIRNAITNKFTGNLFVYTQYAVATGHIRSGTGRIISDRRLADRTTEIRPLV